MAAGGYAWCRVARQERDTENACVNAGIARISTLVAVPVSRVHVRDNRFVHRGDVWFEVDPRPFAVALAKARTQAASLVAAEARLERAWEAASGGVAALIVDASDRVDANVEETELAGVAPGQPADVVVDMYPERVFHGRVEGVSGGTGAAFALLPPQNATGNGVKVTQRVPVKVRVVDADAEYAIRVGATATVSIRVN